MPFCGFLRVSADLADGQLTGNFLTEQGGNGGKNLLWLGHPAGTLLPATQPTCVRTNQLKAVLA